MLPQTTNTVLMTGLLAALGLFPMAVPTGIGSETQKPLAVVVIGGLVTATLWSVRDGAARRKGDDSGIDSLLMDRPDSALSKRCDRRREQRRLRPLPQDAPARVRNRGAFGGMLQIP